MFVLRDPNLFAIFFGLDRNDLFVVLLFLNERTPALVGADCYPVGLFAAYFLLFSDPFRTPPAW